MIMGLLVIMKSAIDVDGPTHLIVSRQKDGDRVDEQSMSSVNRIGFVRLLSLSGSLLTAVCVLAAVVAGCTSPSVTGPRNEIASGSSSAEPSLPSGPRFVAGGPDSEDYGASQGYPIGDRSTFFQIPFLVGSQSHLDQIFEGRVIRRASDAVASRARGHRTDAPLRVRGLRPVRLTTISRATRRPASSSRAAKRSSSSATSTAATIGIASPRGRWPRPSPPC